MSLIVHPDYLVQMQEEDELIQKYRKKKISFEEFKRGLEKLMEYQDINEKFLNKEISLEEAQKEIKEWEKKYGVKYE